MAAEREQVVANLAGARRELLAAIGGLTDEQLSKAGCVGDWAAKDLLSHVASWDEVCTQDFRRLARGDTPGLVAFKPERVDEYNAALMAFRLHLPAAQARREMDVARSDMLEAIKALPDTHFAQGQFARALTDIEANHDREHAQMIRAWREKQGL